MKSVIASKAVKDFGLGQEAQGMAQQCCAEFVATQHQSKIIAALDAITFWVNITPYYPGGALTLLDNTTPYLPLDSH